MRLEDSFHTDTIRNLANGKSGVHATIALGNDNTFKRLQPLTVTFLDFHLYGNRITRTEVRNVLFQLFLFKLFNNVAHD